MRRVILASGSPRRSDILEQAGIPFEVFISHKEEVITKELPSEAVEELSKMKALDVAEHFMSHKDYLIIGADTMVAYNGYKLGKPKDIDDASRMLSMLQGKTHQVYTGVTLVYDLEEVTGAAWTIKTHTFYAVTDVTMYPMSEAEIEAYVKTGEPRDKAGAYAIQGRCARYIKEIHGEYNNVVGFPIARTIKEIKEIGIQL